MIAPHFRKGTETAVPWYLEDSRVFEDREEAARQPVTARGSGLDFGVPADRERRRGDVERERPDEQPEAEEVERMIVITRYRGHSRYGTMRRVPQGSVTDRPVPSCPALGVSATLPPRA